MVEYLKRSKGIILSSSFPMIRKSKELNPFETKIWIYSWGYLSRSDWSFILDIFIYRSNTKAILRSCDFLSRIIVSIGEARGEIKLNGFFRRRKIVNGRSFSIEKTAKLFFDTITRKDSRREDRSVIAKDARSPRMHISLRWQIYRRHGYPSVPASSFILSFVPSCLFLFHLSLKIP